MMKYWISDQAKDGQLDLNGFVDLALDDWI